MVNEKLRLQLLSLVESDTTVRRKLAKSGELYEGYNPKMETVHNKNAAELERIISEHGWPGKSIAGEDGARAAWLILQHAIGKPEVQRKYLPVLKREGQAGEIPLLFYAMLYDRICMYEGRPQKYGTQFDWDENGEISPYTIEDPKAIDERRMEVGLPALDADIKRQRKSVKESGERPPKDYFARKAQMEVWCRRVGWRE